MTTLAQIVPPHRPTSAALLAALVAAYESDADVPPVVAIDFGHSVVALCGSHRIAAALEVYDETTDAEDIGWLIYDREALYTDAPADLRALLNELSADNVSDYSVFAAAIAKHLPAEANEALIGQ